MTLGDEVLTAWINQLRTPGERAYAKSHWAFLQGLGDQPRPQDYNLRADADKTGSISVV